VTARFPDQGGSDAVQPRIDQGLAVDGHFPANGNEHFDLLYRRVGVLAGDRLGQIDFQLGFPGEGGRDHEEDQQQEYHVDQWCQVDVRLDPGPASEIDDQLPLAAVVARRAARLGSVAAVAFSAAAPLLPSSRWPCMTSTSLVASCSIATTSSSTRRTRKRGKNSAGRATVRPAAVVSSALEIPPASTAVLPVPCSMTALNTSIMPITVPNRPSSK